MGVEVMYHLRRINFQNHVLHANNNNNNGNNGKTNGVGEPSIVAKIEINDGDEPTKIPSLRANSTYILLDKSTKIGRNPELVDVVLHSHVHSNMISRSHSEIFLESGNYYISDTSLNGTYVNDYRAPKRRKDEPPYRYKQLLREGDVIKFGHVNGAAINEGEHAPQESADFIFKFERAIPDHHYFGYTERGERERRDGTRAYMQINSDRVMPYDPYTASPPTAAAIIGVPPPQPHSQPQSQPHVAFNGKTLLSQQQQQLLAQRLEPTSGGTIAAARNVAAVAPLPATNPKIVSGTGGTFAPSPQQQPQLQVYQPQSVSTVTNTTFALNQSPSLKQQQSLPQLPQQSQSQASLSSVLASSLPPQQQQQLAAAVAAAANLNSDDLAAQLRQIVASAVTATTAANDNCGGGASAVAATAASVSTNGADTLAAFNPLFYLQRLQQQHNAAGHATLYNGGLQAAAAAYLNPSLWSNVNLNAFRNALQPTNNGTDWLHLNVTSQPLAGTNFTPAYSVASSSTVGNNIGNAATVAAAAALQQHLRNGNTSGTYTVPPQHQNNAAISVASCVNTCAPSTSENVLTASTYKASGISQISSVIGGSTIAAGHPPSSDVSAMAAAFLPNTFANLTPQQQRELFAAAAQQQQQQLLKKEDDATSISHFSSWSTSTMSTSTAPTTMAQPPASQHPHHQHVLSNSPQLRANPQQQPQSQQQQLPPALAAALRQSGAASLAQQVNGNAISQQQRIANVIAAAAAGSNSQIGRELYSSLLPTTSTSGSGGNDLLAAAAAQSAVLGRLISPNGAASTTSAAQLSVLVAGGVSVAASSAAASIGSAELVSPTSAASGEPPARIASLKDFDDTKFGNATSIHSLAAKYFDNKPSTAVTTDQKLATVDVQTSLLKKQSNVARLTPAVSIEAVKVDRLSTLKDAAALLSHDQTAGKTLAEPPNATTTAPTTVEGVKTMECDSSVPSPPKFVDGSLVCGDLKLEERNSPSLSSPSRPCSYQSVPLSPPRAPCPKIDESDAESRLSEVMRRSLSNDSLTSLQRKDDKISDEVALKSATSNDTFAGLEQQTLDESDVPIEPRALSKSSATTLKSASSAVPAKRNEVERLLQDLTAGNCSWMYQASRQNANRRLADSTALGTGVKSLRLDERKKRELLRKKSHKLMRQISDESSDEDEPPAGSATKNLSARQQPNEKPKRDDDGNTSTQSSSSSEGESANESAANSTTAQKRTNSLSHPKNMKQSTNIKTTVPQKSTNGTNSKRSTNSTEQRTSVSQKEKLKKKSSSSLVKPAAKRKSTDHGKKPPADSSDASDCDDTVPAVAKKANRSATKASTKLRNKANDKISTDKPKKLSKKGGGESSSSSSGSGLIDEWNFHDPERSVCAHGACRKPQDENVNWAACDACDKWFHTLCALGSNVSLGDDTDFRCGCRTASGRAETVPPLAAVAVGTATGSNKRK